MLFMYKNLYTKTLPKNCTFSFGLSMVSKLNYLMIYIKKTGQMNWKFYYIFMIKHFLQSQIFFLLILLKIKFYKFLLFTFSCDPAVAGSVLPQKSSFGGCLPPHFKTRTYLWWIYFLNFINFTFFYDTSYF